MIITALLFMFLSVFVQAQVFHGTLTQSSQSAIHPFTTSEDGDVFITVACGTQLNLASGGVTVLDSNGVSGLYSYSQATGSTFEHRIPNLRGGNYFLRLTKDDRSFYYGDYTATVRLQPCAVPDAAGNNESKAQAYDLPLEQTISGHLGYRGQGLPSRQTAWFKIQVPSAGSLSFELTTSGVGAIPIRQSDGDLNLASYGNGVGLYDIDGTSRLYSSSQGQAAQITHQVTHLQAGTYYIRLEKDDRSFYWGSYTLKATAVPSDVAHVVGANDVIERAFELDKNYTVSGHLGYRGQGLPSPQSAWFKIQLPSAGSLSFELTTSGGGTIPIRQSDGDLNTAGYGNGVALYGIDGTSRLYSYSQGPAAQITHQIGRLQAGTYYIRLLKDDRSFYWGSYTLKATTIADTTNKVAVTAAMLSASSTYNGYTPWTAFDGVMTQNSGWSSSGGQQQAWLIVDFGTVRNIAHVSVFPDRYIATDPSYSYLDRFRVDVWNNGAWQTVSPLTSTPTETWYPATVNFLTDKIRFWFESDGNGPQVKEIEIYEMISEPSLKATLLNGGLLHLEWSSQSGSSYQIQSSTSLAPNTWSDEGSPFSGTGGIITANFSIGPEPKKFFRLKWSR